ncbi:hypothetical protein P3S68_026555 [Capsicum galapagoense]
MALEYFRQVLGSISIKICGGDEEVEELAEAVGGLPDCLVIDIVSRLPIEILVRCRSDLRAFMSSRHFTILHHAIKPMVLLYTLDDTSKQNKQLYVIDKTGQLTYLSRQPVAVNNSKLYLLYSCQGVFLFFDGKLAPTTNYVLNPITQEEVIIQHTYQPDRLCGLYYCCRDHQFKLLCYVQVPESDATLCQYLIYIFKTPSWRKIRSSSSFNFLPITHSPAVVNGALHWILLPDVENKGVPPCNSCGDNGIIVFRMDNEQLFVKPHPVSHVCNGQLQEHRMMC